MLPRRTLLRTTRLLLGAFLLAQAALALAACDWSSRDAARAVAMAGGAASAPCHEASEAMADAGLCLAHCLGAQQSLDKPSAAVPALVVLPAFPVSVPAPGLRVPPRERPRAAAAPPPRILFQSFLI
jgi:hypothetical protein